MTMNKQRRTSNINNVVTYDTSNNVTVPASITQGFVASSMLKADANGKIIGASSGTDFQSPITLTTIGTSGVATLIGGTLNIPNYNVQITLTTTGSSGPATLIGNTLNIPQYSAGGSVTSVSALTIGTAGTDISSTVADPTTTPVITLNIPTASATNRGALSSSDWSTFNSKQNTITLTTTGTGGPATLIGSTLNIPQYSGGGGSGMAIGGNITSATQGSVLFAGVGGVLSQDNSNFFWDDANDRLGVGTSAPSNEIHVYETNNASVAIKIENPTSGTAVSSNLNLFTNTSAGYLQFQKRSSTTTATGIIGVNAGLLYNTVGDLVIATGDASSWIKFATNGVSSYQMALTSSGNLILGKTSDGGQRLQVKGQANFGDMDSLIGVIAYASSITTRLGIFRGPILHSNLADVSLYIDTGGSNGAGSQPVRIYTDIYGGVTTPFPICIQGNGRETIFGQDTITTNASSLVTMVSTTKGFLPPRMTSAQRTAIASPATGLIVYQTDGSVGLYLRNSTAWVLLGSGGGGGTGTVTSVSVVTANGLAGTVANSTTTPAITLSTTVSGMLKGNGVAINAAVLDVDYVNKNIYNNNGGLSSSRIVDFVEYELYFGTSSEYVNYAFHRKGVIPGIQILALSADRTLTNTTSQQAFFTPSFNTLTLVQQQTYFFSGVFYLTTMSAISGNLTIDIKGGGTITISSIMYFTTGFDNNNVGTANTLSGGVSTTSSYSTPVTAETGTQLILRFEGTLRIPLLGSGTIIPSVSLTNAASATAKANSYFQIYPVSSDTMTKVQVD